MQIVLRDLDQAPFLSKVLNFAKEEEIFSEEDIAQIKHKGVLMSLKLADKFYNKYKMHLLEQASQDVIGVASLGLAALTSHDQVKAMLLLKKPDGLVKSFQKGWSMLTVVSKYRLLHSKSVYGDVEQRLLESISAPADTDEWNGWDNYQDALKEHQGYQAAEAVKAMFFNNPVFDPIECETLEEMFAESLIYRLFFGANAKVKEDLKKRITDVNFNDEWLEPEFIVDLMDKNLAILPEQLQQSVLGELNKSFVPSIIKTIKFAKKYQKHVIEGATPEKLERIEHKEGMAGVILGWPLYLLL
ncbi:hypothetical protein D5018_02670 [Parashewanella curva]|uniref:Uncharacterized protein n=1 Tax=Parashewanella curva TaxID=2338552 RepID=A0A3L8Q2K0_9GAMM|nr:hypothetical protein [Parashewanella curva]RLV61178.1 hypothetical protein D5018_02670 [Parashewanella curva]